VTTDWGTQTNQWFFCRSPTAGWYVECSNQAAVHKWASMMRAQSFHA
jgi:hypothetical protein